MNYIIKDEEKYYVSEGFATLTKSKATRYSSLEELLTKVPMYKDWNWDYKIFTIDSNDNIELCKESEWAKIYKQMKSEGKMDHFNNTQSSFIRVTRK